MLPVSLLLAAVLQQPVTAPPAAAPTPIPMGIGDTSPFRRLALPTPNEYRTGAGTPGPRYWQQRVDYTIRASLDTGTHTVSGKETIRYTNHAPDSLRYVWFQTDQNIYREDSRGSFINPADARWSARGFQGGYTITDLSAVRGAEPGHGDTPLRRAPLATTANGTMLRADLDRPLPPGGSVTMELTFSFQVPEHGSDRMGREHFPAGWLYEIAEWYPRLAVYDDVRGWNTEQYLGQGEFYLEYGDIDFTLTVPRSFIVAASGTLVNPVEVLTATERARLARARVADSTVAIVAREEAGQPSTRPAGATPTLTWHFTAKNVRDVAWAASPGFVWDASAWQGVLMQSYYPPEANPDWANSTAYVRHTIKHYSEKWFQYPYPTAINIAGPVGGMEYPMIVFCGARAGGRGLFGVTTHELGHQWFPMIVGSNERLYAWMDEGFNTFINIYSGLAFYHDTTLAGRGGSGPMGPLRGDRARRAVDAPRRSGAAPHAWPGGVQQAGHRALPAAPPHSRRHDPLRRRVPRIHPALGVQAPHAGRLLPLDGGRPGRGPVVVLARVVLPLGRRRSGGGFRDDADRQHGCQDRPYLAVLSAASSRCRWTSPSRTPTARARRCGSPSRSGYWAITTSTSGRCRASSRRSRSTRDTTFRTCGERTMCG